MHCFNYWTVAEKGETKFQFAEIYFLYLICTKMNTNIENNEFYAIFMDSKFSALDLFFRIQKMWPLDVEKFKGDAISTKIRIVFFANLVIITHITQFRSNRLT